jgi:hypothetical protein
LVGGLANILNKPHYFPNIIVINLQPPLVPLVVFNKGDFDMHEVSRIINNIIKDETARKERAVARIFTIKINDLHRTQLEETGDGKISDANWNILHAAAVLEGEKLDKATQIEYAITNLFYHKNITVELIDEFFEEIQDEKITKQFLLKCLATAMHDKASKSIFMNHLPESTKEKLGIDKKSIQNFKSQVEQLKKQYN